ncbi:hypothetical protein DM02DRAFT_731403 [Periconia macrospinosa]|uniref:BTB domain-containing protein n=1 Tax=Periconia macrospinosa TaxID=97972 RepID=A0A2V1DDC2_9PLEO|nr:hypothetical protein DM02DRAFT_731403 [Periconia macrospinosa]
MSANKNGTGIPPDTGTGLHVNRGLEAFSNSPTFSDIVIRYGDSGGCTFYGHKIILATASDWFRAAFCSGFAETNQSEITLQDDDQAILGIVLEAAYPSNLRRQTYAKYWDDIITVLQVYQVADKYLFPGVKNLGAFHFHRNIVRILQDCGTTPMLDTFVHLLEELYHRTITGVKSNHELVLTLMPEVCDGLLTNHYGEKHKLITEAAKRVPEFAQDLFVHMMGKVEKSSADQDTTQQELSYVHPVLCPHCGKSWMIDHNAEARGHCYNCGAENSNWFRPELACKGGQGCECHYNVEGN